MMLKVNGKCSPFEVKAGRRNQEAQISFAEFGKVFLKNAKLFHTVKVWSTREVTNSNDVPKNLM